MYELCLGCQQVALGVHDRRWTLLEVLAVYGQSIGSAEVPRDAYGRPWVCVGGGGGMCARHGTFVGGVGCVCARQDIHQQQLICTNGVGAHWRRRKCIGGTWCRRAALDVHWLHGTRRICMGSTSGTESVLDSSNDISPLQGAFQRHPST